MISVLVVFNVLLLCATFGESVSAMLDYVCTIAHEVASTASTPISTILEGTAISLLFADHHTLLFFVLAIVGNYVCAEIAWAVVPATGSGEG